MKLPNSIRSLHSNFFQLELLFENGRIAEFRLSLGVPVAFGIAAIEILRIFLHR